MGEGHIQKFTQAIKLKLAICILSLATTALALQWCLVELANLNTVLSTGISFIFAIIAGIISATILGNKITKPTNYLSQAIMHISPSEHLVASPNMDDLKFGKELVTTLTRIVYDYAAVSQHSQTTGTQLPASLFDQLPVAVIGINSEGFIALANTRAKATTKTDNPIGQKLSDFLIFNSENDATLEAWLDEVKQKSLTDFKLWEKVELQTINRDTLGYFDVAASFNSNSASGSDIIVTFYDHSEAYSNEEASMSFVAMAVHEMRTPVTVMRGYVEAFEDELKDNLTPQIKDDLQKMNASAEALSSFVSNILNVARINQGQLVLNLSEHSWNKALPQIVDSLRNRTEAYGKTIELRMQPDMPKVAIDRMTIGEVITNLVENAVKYTPQDSKITIVSQINREGLIETTVQDQGVGIPEAVMPHLFSKFYRNHRNKAQIGGTGLGLFLCKSIVNAHKGNIWANSKENEGSTFGFTLLPYTELATELQSKDNNGITHGSHGWIKNHSMQRH